MLQHLEKEGQQDEKEAAEEEFYSMNLQEKSDEDADDFISFESEEKVVELLKQTENEVKQDETDTA